MTASVSCGGEQHRVTWRRGKLVLEDHDLAAERAMLALGGRPCQCVKVLNTWREVHSWRIPAEVFRQMQGGPGGGTRLAPPELVPLTELTLLLTWQRAWKRSFHLSPHAGLVEEQLRRRARQPLLDHVGRWRQVAGSRMVSGVTVEMARPGRPPSLTGSMDTVAVRATATLDARWLVRVWARGLGAVDDAFVLDVVGPPRVDTAAATGKGGAGDRAEVLAARWEQEAPGRWAPVTRPAVLDRPAGGDWHATWPDDAGGS